MLGARHCHLSADGRHLHQVCGFCKINTGRPTPLDPDERRVGESVHQMGLQHAVLTNVNRDEQPDGGAWVFCREHPVDSPIASPATIEVLIPDFKLVRHCKLSWTPSQKFYANHNTETVRAL